MLSARVGIMIRWRLVPPEARVGPVGWLAARTSATPMSRQRVVEVRCMVLARAVIGDIRVLTV
jgi:hypothetical protein